MVETWAQQISPLLNRGLGALTGWLPFSLAEVGGVTLLILLVLRLGYEMGEGWRDGRWTGLLAVLRRRTRQALLLALGTALYFYGVWGLNYARAPLRERLGWEDPGQTSVAELLEIGSQLADLSNRYYLESQGGKELPEASPLPFSLSEMDVELQQGFVKVTERFHLEAAVAIPRARPKPLLATWWMVQVGLLGFYSPFTGEANILANAPPQQLPQALAHEQAHQRGIAPEDEANFVGFLASGLSPHPYCRYSAYLFAWKQVYYELSSNDRAAARELVNKVGPGPLQDMKAAWQFWHANEGMLRELGRSVNDTYLKANGQVGVQAYNQSLLLILAWSRLNQGQVRLE